MKASRYCIFETAIGTCGIAWSLEDASITAFELASSTPENRLRRLTGNNTPDEPPAYVREQIERVQRHLNGQHEEFKDVTVDFDGIEPFALQVYEAIRLIPAGETRTYGEIAKKIGHPGAAQAVGQALGRNPIPLIVPCHRVSAAGGKSGGFSAPGGRNTKARLLGIEGAILDL